MNSDNVKTAIKVMQRVEDNEYPFNLEKWQEGKRRTTEKGAVNCGTICCFATWLAISPEGRRDGFNFDPNVPRYKKGRNIYRGSTAIAYYLDIPEYIAKGLVGTGGFSFCNFNNYYHKPLIAVTPSDVIEALNNILNNVTECYT